MKRLKDMINKIIGFNYEREIILSELDLNKSSRYNTKKELFNSYKLEPFEEKHLATLMTFCEECGDDGQIDNIEHFIERGFNGILFFKDTTLIGYFWWHDKQSRGYHYDLNRLPIKLKNEHEIYCEYFYIKPEHRGQGIALYLLSEIHSKWYKDGYTKLYGYVDTNNISAQWIYRILAWEEIRRIKEYSIIINNKKRRFFFYGTHPKDLYLFFSINMVRLFRRKILKLINL